MLLSKVIKPDVLQVESTNECFMSCKPCMRKYLERPIGYISLEDFKKLPLSSFKEICLHGWGEPLLHPHIFDLIRHVKSLNIKASMGTNGYLVKEMVDEILESGLDEISFGIYTLEGKEKPISGLEELLAARRRRTKPTIYIDVTVFRDNYEEIPELVKFFLDMGVDGIILHRLFNIYKVDPSAKYISKKEEKSLFKKVKEIGGKKVYLPIKHLTPCRVVFYTMFVTWDCNQTPCVYLSETYLGDARTDYSTMLKRHLKFVSGMRKNEVCRKCFW